MVGINVGVLAFAVALAMATALCCGLIPAYRASRLDLSSTLKASSRAVFGLGGRSLVSGGLVVVEMMCATVLLVGAGLLTQSLIRLGSAPLGFRTGGLFDGVSQASQKRVSTAERRGAFYDRVITALGSVPSIDGVALATSLVRGQGTNVLAVEGRPAPMPGSAVPDVGQDSVSPDYFRAPPAIVVRRPAAIGKGQRRSSRTPMRTASAYQSGGGTRTPGLSVRAAIAYQSERVVRA